MDSPRISFTDFVDFVARPGMPAKLTKVREIKRRGPYSAWADYYRPVREAVIRTHATGRDKRAIRGSIAHLARLGYEFAERLPSYESLAEAYVRWWGRKRIEWFEPGWEIASLGGLPSAVTISVNPELGLDIEGTPHLVKLYFKEEPLPHRLAEVAARLMDRVLGRQAPRDAAMAILDIRRQRLHAMIPRPDLDVLLEAETAAFIALWAQA